MSRQTIEQGIQAIQNGQHGEGARLLRIGLNDDTISGPLRAVALMWLAETREDVAFRVDCYRQALAADPGNADVQQRLNYWQNQPPAPLGSMPPLSGQSASDMRDDYQGSGPTERMPPMQDTLANTGGYTIGPQTPPPNPQLTNRISGDTRFVGVWGGPNGDGSGFFLTQNGLVATARNVVREQTKVTVALPSGQQFNGHVVRAFPVYDLALVKVSVQVPTLPIFSQTDAIPPEALIVALLHGGRTIRSKRRRTQHQMADHWFPTLITPETIDAGGAPIYDAQGVLVGMLTRNVSRTNNTVYGLHTFMIQRCLAFYQREQATTSNAVLCQSCGALSQASNYGAYYCETCGTVLPQFENRPRTRQEQTASLYGDEQAAPCPHCGARIGTYEDYCLRCGYDVTRPINEQV